MAGSNYDVNIKLNVRDINRQLNNLERRISKLNQLATGQRGAGKTVLKTERDKLAVATRTFRKEQQITKEKQKQSRIENQMTKNINARSVASPASKPKAGTRGATGGGGKGGVLSGALISGAFPLLFGQGLVGGAVGFAGGAIGGAFGGQTGGFAGGLVATAGLTLLTNFRDGINELGSALSPANANIDQSIEKLGIINRSRAAEIKLIEKFQGKQAALAEITKDTAKVIGNDGVRALREFAETMKLLGSGFTDTLLQIQAFSADLFNRVFNFTGGDLNKAKAILGQEDSAVTALNKNTEALNTLRNQPGMTEQPDFNAFSQSFTDFSGENTLPLSEQGKIERNKLQNERKILEFVIKQRAAKKAGAELDKEIGVEHRKLLGTIDGQLAVENRILELRKTGLNPELAKQILLVEKSSNNVRTGIENEIQAVEQLLEKEKESGKGYTDKIQFLEITLRSLEKQLDITDKTLKKDKERVIAANRLTRAAKATQDSFDALKQTIATDIADGIQGLIRGATTLNQVMNNVLNKLIDAAFNLAFFGNAGGTLIPGSGLFGGLFRAEGGPVKGGKSYIVGERGPEMFTPGVSGAITPNHQLGGSTNVVVNVDASGSNIEGDEDRGRELGRLISVAVQSELIQQKRPGGLLA